MSIVYLIPTFIAIGKTETLPPYILSAIKDCKVLFVENERTARRYLKALDKQIEIANFEWHTIHKAEKDVQQIFINCIKLKQTIGIISESGCPGIADPGQLLVQLAQKNHCTIKPLVGPSSILLALMASGMNGQQFEFCGYLPIESDKRKKRIQELEASSAKSDSTKIFIETPYRNNQLLEAFLQHCQASTLLCIASDITADNESITTKSVKDWKNKKPTLDKVPAIFLLYAGG